MTNLTTTKDYDMYPAGTVLQNVVDMGNHWRGISASMYGTYEIDLPKEIFEPAPESEYDALKRLMVKVYTKHGKAEVLAVLDRLKANNLADLDQKLYGEAAKLAKQALAKPVIQAYKLPLQNHVRKWTHECFGDEIARDTVERNHRFLEEALELVQAGDCTKAEALQLVEYVYSRPAGELRQEVGGVLVTLAALCNAREIDMLKAGEAELARCFDNIERIRAKQKAKPKVGPLPEATPAASAWQPMSTAPRDGTAVLLRAPSYPGRNPIYMSGEWLFDCDPPCWYCCDSSDLYHDEGYVTGWMPIPK